MGTAGYMSPEQALGEPATPKSDLYSLGIVLCEAVSGRLPFTAESPIAVSVKHLNEPPCPPQRLNPDVPSGMNATILKLRAKDPADRHADTDELAEDLWRAWRGMPPAAAAVQEGAKTVQAPLPRGPAPAGGRHPAAQEKEPGAPASRAAAPPARPSRPGLGARADARPAWRAGREGPPVEGLPRGQAQGRLNDAGLASETRTREAPGAEAGRVISQSPCGGKSVARGSAVTLTVARSSTVTIPEVVSLSLADAEAELRGAGLTVGRRYDLRSESAAKGVVEQGIAAGQEVSSGSAVNVGVSSGAAAPASASPASSASPPSSQETLVSPAPGDGSAGASASHRAEPEGQGPGGLRARRIGEAFRGEAAEGQGTEGQGRGRPGRKEGPGREGTGRARGWVPLE